MPVIVSTDHIKASMAVATESVGHVVNHYGIEAPKQILWKGWEPGGEYTKQLVIKNSNVKTQKLQFQ